MNFGSSVLHIVIEPAKNCCRNCGGEDTIEQLFIVHIIECSCQIEHDEYGSVSWFFLVKPAAMSAVIVDSAVPIECFSQRPCCTGCKGMCVSILGSRSFSSVLAAGHSRLIGRQFVPMLMCMPVLG